jgi:SEC-C motif-containing protein
MKCPCCSTKIFNDCCGAIINSYDKKEGNVIAQSPEQLMRSRFSAYATKNADYIFNTYAKETRNNLTLDDLKQELDNCIWTKLTIDDCSSFEPNKTTTHPKTYPTVSFSAYYLVGNNSGAHSSSHTLWKMSEKSRFIYTNQWYYLDGDNIEHQALGRIKSNDICPCFKNTLEGGLTHIKKAKKLKHCCGLLLIK